MATKPKLNDMSIDPSTLKGKKESEVTPEKEGAKDNKAPRLVKERKDPSRYISHHRGHGKQKATVCVAKGEEVQRVLRKDAEKLVATGWAYCSRSKWRKSLKGA
jgi:hypothetical protein